MIQQLNDSSEHDYVICFIASLCLAKLNVHNYIYIYIIQEHILLSSFNMLIKFLHLFFLNFLQINILKLQKLKKLSLYN